MNLSPEEIEALTKRRRPGWQARQLDYLGIPYKRRSDGSLLVLRAHVEATQDVRPKEREPRLRLDA